MTRPTDLPPASFWAHGTRSRYVSGCRCRRCRKANRTYQQQREIYIAATGQTNRLIPASYARRRLQALSDAQVGRRAVARVSGVSATILQEIRSGRKRQIREDTERRILAVPFTSHSPTALVDATMTWQRVRALQHWGWRKVRIAEAIGQVRALQLGKSKVTARQQEAVRKVFVREWAVHYRPAQILWRT